MRLENSSKKDILNPTIQLKLSNDSSLLLRHTTKMRIPFFDPKNILR